MLFSLNYLRELSIVIIENLLILFLNSFLVSSCVNGLFNHSLIDEHLSSQCIFLIYIFLTPSGGYGQEW